MSTAVTTSFKPFAVAVQKLLAASEEDLRKRLVELGS